MNSGRSGRDPSPPTADGEFEIGARASFVAAPGYRDTLDAEELVARVRRLPAAAFLDLRDLPAPEPMERVLQACAQLAPGDAFAARTPRFPRMLLPILDHKGLLWAALAQPDGSGLVYVERPASP